MRADAGSGVAGLGRFDLDRSYKAGHQVTFDGGHWVANADVEGEPPSQKSEYFWVDQARDHNGSLGVTWLAEILTPTQDMRVSAIELMGNGNSNVPAGSFGFAEPFPQGGTPQFILNENGESSETAVASFSAASGSARLALNGTVRLQAGLTYALVLKGIAGWVGLGRSAEADRINGALHVDLWGGNGSFGSTYTAYHMKYWLVQSGLAEKWDMAASAAFASGAGAYRPIDQSLGLLVGSDQFKWDGDADKEARMYFDKTKRAFRAGRAQSQWDVVGEGSAALNSLNRASGTDSFATGRFTQANGVEATAHGYSAMATGTRSYAQGSNTHASGQYAHAEGASTLASGTSAHAQGQSTTAGGNYAHAEGYLSEASNTSAHAEGFISTASGYASHAEGVESTASGYASHVEGRASTASGAYSHASGYDALASQQAQFVLAGGQFATRGDAQASRLVQHEISADGTPIVLHAGNGSASTSGPNSTNTLRLLASRAHKVRIEAVARRTDVQGEMAGFSWEGLVGRDSTGNARIIGTPVTKAWSDAAAAGWTLTVGINTTDATNNYLEILATGETGKTIRWVAEVNTVEVAG